MADPPVGRVLHVYKDVFPPVVGGIERHIDSIRLALPEFTHDVLVCARGFRTRIQRSPSPRSGVEVLVGEFGRLYSTPIAPAFPFWLRRLSKEAVLHLHVPQPLAELSATLVAPRRPLVVSYHADIFRQRHLLYLYGPLLRRCLRSADFVVAGSEALRQHSPLIQSAGVPTELVPYVVDTERWNQARADPAVLHRHRATYGQVHVVAAGRLVSYKGFDQLVLAARTFQHQVVIVGDGPERGRLQSLIGRLGLENRVHLVGALSDDDLLNHYAAATVFVLPSVNRAESFGISLLEAQATGLPVIATDVGTGTQEAFVQGLAGLLVPAADPAALAGGIREILDAPDRASAMGREGKAWVQKTHHPRVLAERLAPIYSKLMQRLETGGRSN